MILPTRLQLNTLIALVGFLFITAHATASDITSEDKGSPCEYSESGALLAGDAACSGPMSVALLPGSGILFTGLDHEGSIADPWILLYDLSADDGTLKLMGGFGPVLPFNPALLTPGNPTESEHWFARYFSMTVTNLTPRTWRGFDLELQQTLGLASSNSDSISFGQIERDPQTLFLFPTSDLFSAVSFEANEKDAIRFRGGIVVPGDSFTLNFLISDNGPTPTFFLREQAVVVPEPGTLSLCFLTLIFLLAAGRLRYRNNSAKG